MKPAHPGKKHIRIHRPTGANPKAWAQNNRERIQSFLLDVTVAPRSLYLDVYYEPGQEILIIEEVLRYAGVISVCHTGSILD